MINNRYIKEFKALHGCCFLNSSSRTQFREPTNNSHPSEPSGLVFVREDQLGQQGQDFVRPSARQHQSMSGHRASHAAEAEAGILAGALVSC